MKIATREVYPAIQVWLAQWKMSAPDLEMLPPVCYFESDAAVGFLYETNSKLAILDHLISNPELPKDKRDEALDRIVTAILLRAKEKGLTIMATTTNPAVVERALKHGFTEAKDKYSALVIQP